MPSAESDPAHPPPVPLVLAAVLVVVTGAMVALVPSHRDAEGAIAVGTRTWILKRPRERAASHLICSRKQYPFKTCNLSVDGGDPWFNVQGRPWSSVAVDVPTDLDREGGCLTGGLPAVKHLILDQVLLDQPLPSDQQGRGF